MGKRVGKFPTVPGAKSHMDKTVSFLRPEHLAPIRSLSLRAKSIVEGTIAGIHKSPYHGFSAEFLEYRKYQCGEDSRKIDWRKFAKTGKSVVRLFEDETNLFATVLIDKSGSMGFSQGSSISKFEYARTLAASLAWILIRQRDAVGLCAFDSAQSLYLPPKSTNAQLNAILKHLDAMESSGETRCGDCVERMAMGMSRRGMCIIVSDFFDDPAEIIRGLRHLRFKRQDVLALWLLDPMEATFSPQQSCEMIDMETNATMTLDKRTAGEYFFATMASHRRIIEDACAGMHIALEMIVTDEPFAKALIRILHKRRRLS